MEINLKIKLKKIISLLELIDSEIKGIQTTKTKFELQQNEIDELIKKIK